LTAAAARGIDAALESPRALAAAVPRKPPTLSALPPIGRIATLRHLAETLVVGAVGGLTLGLAGMPAGWLSGSIIAVAFAALAGRPMMMTVSLLRTLLVLIGISLGAVVTPETLHGMATYPASIGVLLLAMAIVSATGSAYLRKVHGWDSVTAYLAAAPGGLSQVMAVGAELNADLRGIAIVQTIRVVIVAVGLPAALLLFGLAGHSSGSVGGPFELSKLGELALLVAASTVMAIVAYRLHFPGGLLFGAMLTSAVLHGTGYVHVRMPWWVANTAMIAFGAVIGSRFANTSLWLLMQFVGAALGSFAVALAITAVFAAGLIAMLHLPIAEVLIAFAPGSVDAMMLLALALHLDPVYVGAHHLTRIFFVSLTMPMVARRKARALNKPDKAAKPPKGPKSKKPFQD
jgi:membrane AbrB-like protein